MSVAQPYFQIKPPPGALDRLYAVPPGFAAQGQILILNLGPDADAIRVMLIPTGQPPSDSMYIAYDTPIPAN